MDWNMEALIKEHSGWLYRYALFLSAHPDRAQDLVQQTWINAWKHQDQLQDISAIRTWLKKICLNEYRMSMRKQKPIVESIEELEADSVYFVDTKVDDITELSVKEEVKNLRNGCFLGMSGKLTLSQRMAFSLVDMFGLTLQETADLMDVSVSAVKGLLFRARSNLVSFFADHCMFIKEENACRCEAWINFAQQRSKLQHKLKTSFSPEEFREKKVSNQESIRKRVLYYYQHMPVQTPPDSWYEELIHIVTDKKECK